MKNKTPLCSTGHRTGVKHRIDLSSSLERERIRKSNKKVSRFLKKHPEAFSEESLHWAQDGSEVKDEETHIEDSLSQDGGSPAHSSSVEEGRGAAL